ncbi:methionyl-tRNA synthetase isoform 1 [Galdieria sulphuraria]|uniref:methionine--tRNA ligase n=1 Tax=Galdieria sulphuraria TaxID=130081 RepID=M2W4Q0_GALSU|nr:methionyl-tRNA synthetase isoform 1 [Galdieria sulphuraria]EME30721.1 methionyl-tRNA synthetase isoform 1 [Galdieria sulphuraria]|eukprot:XP_005707241.1 methionyl-tRNA synthetase isoform 1 [Galdieria sulphuraria]
METRRVVNPQSKNILITSALPYVNNVPHLGNLVGCVLSADVYARFVRQRKENVLYICGTDEYGTATETKALAEGVTPREICDKFFKLHKDIYDWFDIRFDYFGRTSTSLQTEICQQIFWDIFHNGYVTEESLEQLFCESCGRFLADRYITGTCPMCGFEDARGDQCDNCGRLLNPTDLLTARCSLCKNSPVVRKSDHLFLDLPALKDQLEKWIEKSSVKGDWSYNAIHSTYKWLNEGLKKRCITRDLKWGTPVPLEKYKDKVFYVWFDAPIGYLSITANYTSGWKDWWQNPENVTLFQFMGKDNVPFHTVIFPATLIGTQRKWTMLHHISVTDYLNYEDGKFSKSRGVGVFGNDAKDTGIPTEVWRYYLLVNRPENADTVFSWDDFAAKNNNELLANLGNFVNRTIAFLNSYFEARVPEYELQELDERYIQQVDEELQNYLQTMERVSLKNGLRIAMSISRLGNMYLQETAPWKWMNSDKNRAATVLVVAVNICRLLAVVLEPFMGAVFSRKIFAQLNIPHTDETNYIPDKFHLHLVEPGHVVGKPFLLFSKITTEQASQLRKRFAGGQLKESSPIQTHGEEALAIEMRVGRIVQVEEHVDSNHLYICQVDLGEWGGIKQVVAGIRNYFTKDELLGRTVIVVCNLQPACLAGVESQGMILTAEKKGKVHLLSCNGSGSPGDEDHNYHDVENKHDEGTTESPKVGTLVTINNTTMPMVPLPILDRKAFQNASKLLKIDAQGHVVYNKKYKLIAGTQFVHGSGAQENAKVR